MKRATRRLNMWLMFACIGTAGSALWAQSAPPGPAPRDEARQPDNQPDRPAPPQQPRQDGRRGGRGDGGQDQGRGADRAGSPGEPGRDEAPLPRDPRPRGPRSMRMLDLRDLDNVLPPPDREGPPPDGSDWRRGRGGGLSPFAEAPTPTAASGQDRVADLVHRLAGPLDLNVNPVGRGIVLVMGSDEGQDQLEKMLGQVRDLYAEKYSVEIVAVSFPANQAPAIGSALSGGKVLLRSVQTVPRRTESPVVATEETRFIEGWQPIVADNSVGYQPIPGSVLRGLTCAVVVGAGPETTGGKAGAAVQISLRGMVSDASVTEKLVEIAIPGGKTALPIGLPTVKVRSINGQALATEQPTVLTVVPGFDGDSVIVLGAAVKRL